MPKTDFVIRIGGDTAKDPGIITTGEIITHAAAGAGLHIYTFKTFPAEIKGGQALFQVRIADYILLSQGDAVDVLVVFSQEAYELNAPDLARNAILIYDSGMFQPESAPNRTAYGVPLAEIAQKQVGSLLSKNMVAIGVLSGILGIPREVMVETIKEQFGARGKAIVETNLKALDAGIDYVRQNNIKQADYIFQPHQMLSPKLVLDGDEAVSLGAIAAGVKVFAGYPITPASDILHFMQRELPKFGGDAIQTEDELSAIGVVIGASFAGKKSMTATSGPGLSLMSEQINLAAMAEIPIVIVDVQRGGASTGMPTKMAQGDLNMALYGVHNESPRIVIGLTSVEDSFYGIIRAFNLAEIYQTPVIVLSDQYLGPRKATINEPDLLEIEIIDRTIPDKELLKHYQRYQITESGISPMAIPGMENGAYIAEGIEHDEANAPAYTPEVHSKMTQKRFKKLETLISSEYIDEFVREYGHEYPEIGIISWGSSEGVIREAVSKAEIKGYKVAALHPKLLNPLPVKHIMEFVKLLKRIIVPEANYTGQFAALLRDKCGINPIQLNKDVGLPFTPSEILEKIEEVGENL
ncbi:2-oxoacid:acceptor oxidoreductase subunit alpha [Candidatus Poribacteria bacterium]|nr:2-oxoacid:acceptor oxidoreductase subunit alpha [Candidatus Poribacteria bacterium]